MSLRSHDLVDPGPLPLGALLKANLRRGEGARLGRYVILRLLGEGGMGTVFAAYDEELDRKVAIKLLRSDSRGAPLDRGWLLTEAKAMARLSHPNVAQIYDVGEVDGQVFVAMELIQGVTLRAWLRAHSRRFREILAVFVEAGRGLAAVHAADLVHRDFKPHNVLVGADGRVRVLDFGLAAHHRGVSDGGGRLIESGVSKATVGTPAYMSPEQHAGGETDARSDQFAFCVALFEALFGERPYAGDTSQEVLAAIVSGVTRPIPRESRVPAPIRRALLRGLQADPAARWPSMGALLEVLAADRGAIWRRRAVVAGLVALALALAWSLTRQRALEEEREAAACAGGEARIAEVWGPREGAAIRERFAATGLTYADDTSARVLDRLDRYARAWAEIDRQTCVERRRGRLSEALHGRAQICLSDHRQALAALVRVLADADTDVVERAIKGASSLPQVERCGDPDRLAREIPPPEDPASAAAIAGHRQGIAEVRAALTTGRVRGCAEATAPIVAAAEALARPHLLAEAHFAAALCADALGEYEAAEAAAFAALFAAAATGADTLAVEIGTRLVYVLGYRRGRADDAALWGRLVRAWIRKGGDRDDELGRLESMLAVVELIRGRPEEALAGFRGALERIERAVGREHIETAAVLNNMGAAYNALARLGELEETTGEALRIYREILGPDHPERSLLLSNLGNVRFRRADLDGAIAAHREALELKERSAGPDHPDLATFLNNLGSALSRQGRGREAIAAFERSLTIRERALGPEHPLLANILGNLGGVHLDLGEVDAAAPYIARSLAIRRATQPEHPLVASLLTLFARVHLARGEVRAAEATIAEAAALRERVGGSAEDRGDTLFVRAQVLWAGSRGRGQARGRQEAIALATAAIVDYTEAGPLFRKELADIDAWLAAHRVD